MFVEQILPATSERFAVIDAGASVKDAAGLMAEPHTDLLVVCRDGIVVGVVTKTDIVVQVSRGLESALDAPVDTIMTRDVAFCRATDRLPDVWQVMKERGVQRLPVVDERHNPVGIVYARDALQTLLKETEINDDLLRDFIFGAGYQ